MISTCPSLVPEHVKNSSLKKLNCWQHQFIALKKLDCSLAGFTHFSAEIALCEISYAVLLSFFCEFGRKYLNKKYICVGISFPSVCLHQIRPNKLSIIYMYKSNLKIHRGKNKYACMQK